MMQETKQENAFNLTDLIGFISRHKIALLVIAVVSFVVSLIVCVSIPPKYKEIYKMIPEEPSRIINK